MKDESRRTRLRRGAVLLALGSALIPSGGARRASAQGQAESPGGGDLGKTREAAERGDRDAQYEMGRHYEVGGPVSWNMAEAVMWYRKAAEGGHLAAQERLGLIFYQGRGMPVDGAESILWYGKAAEQGSGVAYAALGMIYESGLGDVAPDPAKAARWYGAAAERGDYFCQSALGKMVAEGRGVRKDLVEGLKWLLLGSHAPPLYGLKVNGPDVLEKVRSKMTSRQIAEAERRVKRYQAAHQPGRATNASGK